MSAEAAPRTARNRKRNRWAIIGAIAVVVILAIVVLPFAMRPKTSAATDKTETVARGDLVVTVSGDGQVVSAATTDVYPEISGTVEKVYVSEGDRVRKGDTLYTISDQNLESGLLQAEASVRQAEQSKMQALQTKVQASASLQQAQLSLMQAEQALDTAENAPVRSQKAVDLAKKQIRSANAQIKAADASIDTANAAIDTADANLKSANNSLADARKQYDYTTVDAPVSGIVTTLSVRKGGSTSGGGGASAASLSAAAASSATGKSGSSASASAGGSSASVFISTEKSLKVRVQMNEVDAPKLRVGQKATVTFDSLPGVSAKGTVTWIAPTATNSGGVVTYDADVRLTSPPKGLRLGMTATADVLTRKATGIITVPNTSVKVDGLQRYVNVRMPDGQIQKVVVTVGSSNDKRTEITSGLKVGDAVLLSAPVAKPGRGGFMMRRGG